MLIVIASVGTYGIFPVISIQKAQAAPAVNVSQQCKTVNGIKWFEYTISGSGWPASPARGVVLVDGMLSQENAFSTTGTMGSSGSGPGGPGFGAGPHTVVMFHDANGNQLLDPGEVSASTTFTSIVCGPNPCTLGYSSIDPTDMNTVVTNSSEGVKIKTVHVENEVFQCQTQINNTKSKAFWPIIVDVSIYTEIIEGIKQNQPVKTFEVVTCKKNATSGELLGCKKEIPRDKLQPISNCIQFPSTLPVKMNTVVITPGVVKTIQAQKEVFKCDTPSKPSIVKDVTIFTEIIENLSEGTVTKAVEVAICIKDIASAKVLSCKATMPSAL